MPQYWERADVLFAFFDKILETSATIRSSRFGAEAQGQSSQDGTLATSIVSNYEVN